MEKKKEFIKLIKKVLTPFAREHDFIFYNPTILIRLNKDTLHIINFDLGTAGFTCDVAIQPIYVPAESLVLSFGNRLSRFNVLINERWKYGESQQEDEFNLLQIVELIKENVLIWFEEVGSAKGIISFIEKGLVNDTKLIIGFPPFMKNLYLGFSYLYEEKIKLAEGALHQVLDNLVADSRTWAVELKQVVNALLLLADDEPEEITKILQEYVEKNYLKLKLKHS